MNVAPWPAPALWASTTAAVRFDEVLDDRQTEPQPPVHAGGRSIGLPERFEDVGQEFG